MTNPNEPIPPKRRLHNLYEEWLRQQQLLLDQLHLLSASSTTKQKDQLQSALIQQVVSHYHDYYQERAAIASDDVFLIFSSPRLSSFERTYLWIAGFKPSLIVKLAESGANDMSLERKRRIERLKAETKWAEREEPP